MGYQMGALKPAETWRMVNEYIFTVPEEMLGIKRSYFPLLFDFLESAVRTLCEGARAPSRIISKLRWKGSPPGPGPRVMLSAPRMSCS